MPIGLGHLWVGLLTLIIYGAIVVAMVAVVRGVVQAARRLGQCVVALERIQQTLGELKSAIEALERRQGKE